jgi:hypothetical protein
MAPPSLASSAHRFRSPFCRLAGDRDRRSALGRAVVPEGFDLVRGSDSPRSAHARRTLAGPLVDRRHSDRRRRFRSERSASRRCVLSPSWMPPGSSSPRRGTP